MFKVFIFCFIFISISCVNKTVNEAEEISEMVFSDGIYKQKINVVYFKDNGKDEQTFNAILKKDRESLSLYCYIGFGISLFKLVDAPGKVLDFQTNQKEIEKNKEFFLKIYPLIKKIMFLSRNSSEYVNKNFNVELKPDHFPVKIELSSENEFHIPARIQIKNDKYFTFEVFNLSFEKIEML